MNNSKNKKMRPAYIENILLWMVMFIGFVTLLFFVIDYATIIRVKDNMDALSDYGASRIAIQGTGTDMITELNDIRIGTIGNIKSSNLVCNSTADTPPTFQVIFITETTDNSIKFYTGKITSKRVVFNEVNSETVSCKLTVTLSN